MSKNVKISDNVIRRLPKYLRRLKDLHAMGKDWVSSNELGGHLHFTASQVRQDFSHFGEFGLQGCGYGIELLEGSIARVLGVDTEMSAVVVGAGNIGRALLGSVPNFV